MARNIGVLIVGLCVCLLWTTDAAAQATAQISGSVRDQSGAVLPGVTVTVTQTATGIVRSTVTNEGGSYVLPNLPIGPYRLEATLSGFRSYAQTGIVLQVNGSAAVDVVLQLGEVAETVEVEASAPLVETREVGISQVIENERILELPLNGRNVTALITLAGGSVQSGTARFNTGGGDQPLVSVGGGVGYGTGYTLDGASHINYINGGAMPVPFPDAVQEFNVETSGLSASSGKGSAVNMVTKSGTNVFHGSAFEFLRDDAFNARPYFATANSTLKRNQFGGTLGGPVLTNRLFFFGAYQGTLLRTDPATSRAFVPTPAMLAGDWTQFAACTGVSLNRGGFVNNRIDPSSYAAPALDVVRRIGLTPNNPCGEVFFSTRSVSDEHQYVGRVDYQVSQQHTLFGRVVLNKYDAPHGGDANPNESILAHNANGYDNLQDAYGFGSTYVLSSTAVNQFRVSVNRIDSSLTSSPGFTFCDIGVRMTCIQPQSYIEITGAFTLGTRLPQGNFWRATTWSISDDVTMLRGTHQWSFGFQAIQGRQHGVSAFFGIGWNVFRGNSTGSPMGDFLTGQVNQFNQAGNPNDHRPHQTTLGLYAADSWVVTPRVTLNYGLRWDPALPQTLSNDRVYSFDYERFQQGTRSTVYPNAPPGLYYPGDTGFIGTSGMETKWWRFAPRVGLAWDVNGNGRSSLRTSYGRSYEVLAGLFKEDWGNAAPWGNLTVLQGVPMVAPWSTPQTPGGDPLPLKTGAAAQFNAGSAYLTNPIDMNMPSTDTWNVSLQRQFGENWMASASYLGTYTKNIWAQDMINPAIFIPGVGNASGACFLNGAAVPVTVAPGTPCSTTANTNLRRRFRLERPLDGGTFGAVSMTVKDSDMVYNGLVLTLQRRVGNLVVSGNHTWSKCLGDYADINSAGPGTDETLTKPGDPKFDRGYCNTDRRHSLNLTTVARLPDFQGRALRMLASGWSVAGIYRIASGAPLNVITGQDNALTSTTNQRPNLIAGRSPYADRSGRPGTNYLDRAAFANPEPGTFGNLQRNSIRGLSSWNLDLSLSRMFQLAQTQRIELRLEGYNVTNSFRSVNPNVTLTSGTFGVIREALDSRVLQFALKYVF
jgi:hypothetical protein